MTYVDAYLIPLERSKLAAYARFSRQVASVYREFGAERIVDCVLDPAVANDAAFHAEGARDALADTSLRDFDAAAGTAPGEIVILSWTEWPSKQRRDEGLARALADPRVQPAEGQEALFEGRRLVAGGFTKLIDI